MNSRKNNSRKNNNRKNNSRKNNNSKKLKKGGSNNNNNNFVVVEDNFNIQDYNENWNVNNTLIIVGHGQQQDRAFVIDNYNILTYTKQFNYLSQQYNNTKCPNINDATTEIINYNLFYNGNISNNVLLDGYKTNTYNGIDTITKPHLYKENDIFFDIKLDFSLEIETFTTDNSITQNSLQGILNYTDFKNTKLIDIFNKCRKYPFNPYYPVTFNKSSNSINYEHKFNNFFLESTELYKKNPYIYSEMLEFIKEGEMIEGYQEPGIVYLSTIITKYIKPIFDNKHFNIVVLSCRDNNILKRNMEIINEDYKTILQNNIDVVKRIYSRNNNNNTLSGFPYTNTNEWLNNNYYPKHLKFLFNY